jgi:hypothetical protein|nr:hypothetical protein [Phenylobacterium sp.]
MSMTEVFRQRADATEAFARGLPLPPERDRYLRLARAFRDLADSAEAERGLEGRDTLDLTISE